MTMRVEPGAIMLGSTTAGADDNVSRMPLPRNVEGMISGIGVLYPTCIRLPSASVLLPAHSPRVCAS